MSDAHYSDHPVTFKEEKNLWVEGRMVKRLPARKSIDQITFIPVKARARPRQMNGLTKSLIRDESDTVDPSMCRVAGRRKR